MIGCIRVSRFHESRVGMPLTKATRSPEMAGLDPTLAALFRVRGVAEAILEAGRVWVRPGRLFTWEDVEASVRWALQGV